MNRILRLLLLSVIGLLLVCCDRSGGGDWGSSLRGQVVDSVSGLPVAEVAIYANDTIDDFLWGHTDSTGAFTLANFGYWESDFYFTKDGYSTRAVRLGTATAKRDVTGVVVTLSP